MKKTVVTSGAGFVGSNLINFLIDLFYNQKKLS